MKRNKLDLPEIYNPLVQMLERDGVQRRLRMKTCNGCEYSKGYDRKDETNITMNNINIEDWVVVPRPCGCPLE